MLVAFVFLFAQSCKPAAGSKVASLENFAAGETINRNLCWRDPKLPKNTKAEAMAHRIMFDPGISDAVRKKLHSEAYFALTAVPEPVLNAFLELGQPFNSRMGA